MDEQPKPRKHKSSKSMREKDKDREKDREKDKEKDKDKDKDLASRSADASDDKKKHKWTVSDDRARELDVLYQTDAFSTLLNLRTDAHTTSKKTAQDTLKHTTTLLRACHVTLRDSLHDAISSVLKAIQDAQSDNSSELASLVGQVVGDFERTVGEAVAEYRAVCSALGGAAEDGGPSSQNHSQNQSQNHPQNHPQKTNHHPHHSSPEAAAHDALTRLTHRLQEASDDLQAMLKVGKNDLCEGAGEARRVCVRVCEGAVKVGRGAGTEAVGRAGKEADRRRHAWKRAVLGNCDQIRSILRESNTSSTPSLPSPAPPTTTTTKGEATTLFAQEVSRDIEEAIRSVDRAVSKAHKSAVAELVDPVQEFETAIAEKVSTITNTLNGSPAWGASKSKKSSNSNSNSSSQGGGAEVGLVGPALKKLSKIDTSQMMCALQEINSPVVLSNGVAKIDAAQVKSLYGASLERAKQTVETAIGSSGVLSTVDKTLLKSAAAILDAVATLQSDGKKLLEETHSNSIKLLDSIKSKMQADTKSSFQKMIAALTNTTASGKDGDEEATHVPPAFGKQSTTAMLSTMSLGVVDATPPSTPNNVRQSLKLSLPPLEDENENTSNHVPTSARAVLHSARREAAKQHGAMQGKTLTMWDMMKQEGNLVYGKDYQRHRCRRLECGCSSFCPRADDKTVCDTHACGHSAEDHGYLDNDFVTAGEAEVLKSIKKKKKDKHDEATKKKHHKKKKKGLRNLFGGKRDDSSEEPPGDSTASFDTSHIEADLALANKLAEIDRMFTIDPVLTQAFEDHGRSAFMAKPNNRNKRTEPEITTVGGTKQKSASLIAAPSEDPRFQWTAAKNRRSSEVIGFNSMDMERMISAVDTKIDVNKDNIAQSRKNSLATTAESPLPAMKNTPTIAENSNSNSNSNSNETVNTNQGRENRSASLAMPAPGAKPKVASSSSMPAVRKGKSGSAYDQYVVEGMVKFQALVRGHLSRKRTLFQLSHAQHSLRVVRELLQTEQVYVQSLNTFRDVFVEPLAKLGSPAVSKLGLDTKLKCIDPVIAIHRWFLNDKLQPELGQFGERVVFAASVVCVGKALRELVPQLKVYNDWVNNYEALMAALGEAKNTDKKVRKLLEEASHNPSAKGLDISSFCIMPVQRIPRYELLLRELIKHTDTDRVEYPILRTTFTMLKDMADLCNESKRSAEQAQKAQVIMGCLKKLPSALAKVRKRRLVHEGLAGVYVQKKLTERWVFLFTDCLLWVQETAFNGASSTYADHLPVDVGKTKVRSNVDKVKIGTSHADQLHLATEVTYGDKSVILFFANTGEKETWEHAIVDTLDELQS